MTAPRDPVADLRRIAFLLERAHESTYRVRAFRGAAAALRARDRAELETLAMSGELRRLRGVGDVTARCVVESLAGEEPAYLSRLRETGGAELADAAADLRATLRGDCHSHTDASDGGSPLEEMVETARERGYEYVAITDHSATHGFGDDVPPDQLLRQVEHIRGLEIEGITVLAGTESNVLLDGSLDYDDSVLEQLDWVVASLHTSFRLSEAEQTERMLRAMEHPLVDVIGHPTGRLIERRAPYPIDIDRVIAKAVETGTFLEINANPDRRDLNDVYAKAAAEAGVTLLIDSDAHWPRTLKNMRYGVATARRAWLTKEHVGNTRPWPELDRLRKRGKG